MIVNPRSGKPLQIASNGSNVEIGTKDNGDDQIFILEHTDNEEYFRIKNIHSGLYLTMPANVGGMTQ
jgi:hypothetical protein